MNVDILSLMAVSAPVTLVGGILTLPPGESAEYVIDTDGLTGFMSVQVNCTSGAVKLTEALSNISTTEGFVEDLTLKGKHMGHDIVPWPDDCSRVSNFRKITIENVGAGNAVVENFVFYGV